MNAYDQRFGKFYGAAHLDVSLTTKDLVRWAYEVACAMEFITAKNVRNFWLK